MFKFFSSTTNRKTGDIPVVYSNKETCPDSCPLKKNGCYAELGLTRLVWIRANESFKSLVSNIRSINKGLLWRYGVAGDLPGRNLQINFTQLRAIVKANIGKFGFAYSHKPVLHGQANKNTINKNRKAIKHANQNGFTINLSADSLKEADSLVNLKIAPVVTILPSNVEEKTLFTPKGNKVIVCPATYKDITCKDCKLCSKQRSVIVGFPAHGVAKRKVNEVFNS